MKRTIVLFLILAMISLCFSGCASNSMPEEMPEDFSFSIAFGTYGKSSYDSKSGKLVKTTDATDPEDYVTTYIMSEEELREVYRLIRELNIERYPDEFGSNEFLGSDPYFTLSLSVRMGDIDKTVVAKQVADYNAGITPRAKKFLKLEGAIRDILVNTEEWKALPDYEFFYD